MSKSVTQLPVVPFSYDEVMSGALPSLFARMALEHGPILKHVVQSGPYTGEEVVYLPDVGALDGSLDVGAQTTLLALRRARCSAQTPGFGE